MKPFVRSVCWFAILGLTSTTAVLAQAGQGRIEGRVTREDGTGLGGVAVVVDQTGAATVTDASGAYRIHDTLEPGTYSLTYTLGDNVATRSDIAVAAGATQQVDLVVDWQVSFAETITVVSVSRRTERIVEAPAAVTLVTEQEIERQAPHGQIPKLLEFTPGVEPTQSGIFDFNLNTRGFNSSLNRRVVVLVDGRDPSVPFLASQEWATVSQYMNDLASAELVRGPSSALYGKNAFNGVLNLVTKSPRLSEGGQLRLTGGELSTLKGEFRWAGELGSDWYLKLNGSYIESEDFTVDRTPASGTDYAGFCTVPGQTDCFVPEVRGLVVEDNEIAFGNARFDKHFANGHFLTLEGGLAELQGTAIQTGIGRFALPSVDRLWSRFSYTADHWNFLGYYNDRDGDEQTSLQSGAETYLDSQNYHLEFQTHWTFADGRARLVAGASHREEEIDSTSPQGRETLVFEPVESDSQAIFGQVDFDLGEKVKLVLAGRYDESTLHDSQFSPKASLVWSAAPDHTLRFGYNEAFQVGNYSELFLQADGAPPLPLQPLEGFCAPVGVSCGFAPAPTRVLAVGNRNLDVEEVTSFEVGYSGILGDRALLTIDYYSSELENFITDLLPNVNPPPLGRLNPDFGPYQPPPELPAPLAAALLATLQGALGPSFALLSNNFDGTPILAAVSYTNFGQVDTQGADVGLDVRLTPEWRFGASYSWFDFDIREELPGDPLVPNAPENKGSFSLGYVGDRFDASVSLRWVEKFRWSVGTLYRGTVPSYETADLTANYRINDNISLGLNVSNLADDEHYQSFGGDLLGRRALGSITFDW